MPYDGSVPVIGLQMMIDEEKSVGALPEGFGASDVLRLEYLKQVQGELTSAAD
jgi:hypothetical protein